MDFETILYDTDGPIAFITLNRPERLNTIVPPMPDEFEAAIHAAAADPAVKVVAKRDRPFADYSQGLPEEQPDPAQVIHPPRR